MSALVFFTPDEAATFEAIAARIWPGEPGDPGAREAGAVYYVDRALAGAYRIHQETYRRGLASVDRAARALYGAPMTLLSGDQQDALLAAMEGNTAPEFPNAALFFELCLTHTMEGVFSDPVHGGNRNFAGWNVVGYPGVQYGYTEAEHSRFSSLEKAPRSIGDVPASEVELSDQPSSE
jgi:gluconate 2-dehydrogenase gamma chain